MSKVYNAIVIKKEDLMHDNNCYECQQQGAVSVDNDLITKVVALMAEKL